MQSVFNGPLHFPHDGEQTSHASPLLNDPSGHVKCCVVVGTSSHFVSSAD